MLRDHDSDLSKLAGSFTQWSADNVDHNVRILYGKGSLHGMEIVYSTTNKFSFSDSTSLPLVKRNKLMKVKDLNSHQRIDIKKYTPSATTGMSKIVFKKTSSLDVMQEFDIPAKYGTLWNCAIFLRERGTRPNWSGYMTEVCRGEYPGKSTVSLLPITDLNPGDLSCVYSTLMFIIDQSKRIIVKIPVITFDQSLWLKATDVVNAKALKVVLIPCGFHLMMSFIGSIGHLMKGSGICSSNAVEHMISGKTVSRALRGHFLVSSALNTKLLSSFSPEGFRLIDETEEGVQAEKYDDGNNDSEDTPDLNTVIVNKLTAEQVNNLEILESKLKKDPNSGKEYLET